MMQIEKYQLSLIVEIVMGTPENLIRIQCRHEHIKLLSNNKKKQTPQLDSNEQCPFLLVTACFT